MRFVSSIFALLVLAFTVHAVEPSHLVMKVPPDAKVYIDGTLTKATGAERLFTSEWADAKHELKIVSGNVEYIQSVQLSAGKTVVVNARPYFGGNEVSQSASPFASSADAEYGVSVDALDEVNEARRRRGLRPFIRDEGLIAAAKSAAAFRAARRIAGHTSNDFAHLPPGANATAAGCAAWEPSWGWGSCCWQENWTYAGAAWAMGQDGRRYMHIFVR